MANGSHAGPARMALTRRKILLLTGGAAAIAAWRYRAMQVGGFLFAAGLRRLLRPEGIPDLRALAREWAAFPPSRRYPQSSSRCVITYHPWYQGFRPAAVKKCLAEAASLGAGFVRSDVRWKDFMPDGENVNEGACAWYQGYFQAVREVFGLQPLMVLTDPSKVVRRFEVAARLAAWNRYVEQVMVRLGGLCKVFQVLNEPNNPVYRIFPYEQTITAITSAAQVIRSHSPQAQVVVNILAGLWRWRPTLETMLRRSGSSVDIVALDYYPGTWTFSPESNWKEVTEFVLDASRSAPGSALHDRVFAILETGYPTNVPHWRTEKQQARYFRTFEKAVRDLDAKTQPKRLALVGVYELCDADSSALLDPEAHCGLLTSEALARKAGFTEVQRIFHSMA